MSLGVLEQMVQGGSQRNSGGVGASAAVTMLVVGWADGWSQISDLHGHGAVSIDVVHCEFRWVLLVLLEEARQHVPSVHRSALSEFDLPSSHL